MRKSKAQRIIPFTKAEIIERAILSENDIKNKRVTSLKKLEKEIAGWAKKI